MARNELPRSVRNLIEQHLHSAADVDTLLLLCRDPSPWTAAGVARELRIGEEQVTDILGRLCRRGLLRTEGGTYLFGPRDTATAESVAALDRLYPTYRVAIVALIYGRPTGSIRDFSNAFRLRDDD